MPELLRHPPLDTLRWNDGDLSRKWIRQRVCQQRRKPGNEHVEALGPVHVKGIASDLWG